LSHVCSLLYSLPDPLQLQRNLLGRLAVGRVRASYEYVILVETSCCPQGQAQQQSERANKRWQLQC
jgi:hypothetical protein